VEIVKDDARGPPPEAADSADVEVSAPRDAKPGEKDNPDLKDMAVGPRPTDGHHVSRQSRW
jgi:hypothetical protein